MIWDARIDLPLDGERYLAHIVEEDPLPRIDTGLLFPDGSKVWKTPRPDPIGFIRWPDKAA